MPAIGEKSMYISRPNFFNTPAVLTQKKLHKIGRINLIAQDYFKENPLVAKIAARDLMKKFVEKGIFFKDDRTGGPIHSLLRQLEREKMLHLIAHVKVARDPVKKKRHFIQPDELLEIEHRL